MYSVLRVTAKENAQPGIRHMADVFKRHLGNIYDGLDPSGDRFSCSVCDGPDWDQHERQINIILNGVELFLAEISPSTVSCEIDVAVYYTEEVKQGIYVTFSVSPSLLTRIAANQISLVFTVYK